MKNECDLFLGQFCNQSAIRSDQISAAVAESSRAIVGIQPKLSRATTAGDVQERPRTSLEPMYSNLDHQT
jgi:hypothetical protein